MTPVEQLREREQVQEQSELRERARQQEAARQDRFRLTLLSARRTMAFSETMSLAVDSFRPARCASR